MKGAPEDSASCHGCGRTLSRFRETCPQCGLQQPVQRISTGTGLLGLLLLALLAAVVALSG